MDKTVRKGIGGKHGLPDDGWTDKAVRTQHPQVAGVMYAFSYVSCVSWEMASRQIEMPTVIKHNITLLIGIEAMPAREGGMGFETQVDGKDLLGLVLAVQTQILDAQSVDVLMDGTPDLLLEERLEMRDAVARDGRQFPNGDVLAQTGVQVFLDQGDGDIGRRGAGRRVLRALSQIDLHGIEE